MGIKPKLLGIGLGVPSYAIAPVPSIMLNFEFDIARNFTLAPFIGFYTYSGRYYWGNRNNVYKDYRYTETVVPIGVKCAYYFDELFHANPKWDFYAAASAGFLYHTLVWESGYEGDVKAVSNTGYLYTNAHVGARLHFKPKASIFLDVSPRFATFGFTFKL